MSLYATGPGMSVDRSPRRIYDPESGRWLTNVLYEWDVGDETHLGPSVSAVLRWCPSLPRFDGPDRDWVDMPARQIAIYRRHRGTLAHYFALDWLVRLVEDEGLKMGDRELAAYEELRNPDDLVGAAERLWVARRRQILGNRGWNTSDVAGWLQGDLTPNEAIDIGIRTEGWTPTCYQQEWLLWDCVEEIRLNALPNFRLAVAEELGGILWVNGVERFKYTSAGEYGGQYDLMLNRVVEGGTVEHSPGEADYFSPPEREFPLHDEYVLVELTFSPISFIDSEARPLRRKMLQLVALAHACRRDVDRLCVVRCSPLEYPDFEVVWLEDTPWSREELLEEFREAARRLRTRYRLPN